VSTLLAAALGTWLGIQALRMTLAMVIWNVAEDNTGYAGEIAVALWIAGIAGSFLVRLLPVRRLDVWLAMLFGILIVLRQALPGENTSPALAFAAWIVWMWWLPAFVRQVARAGTRAELASGVVLGVALQVAGQIALHGLDLELLRDPLSVIAALVLAVAFVLALGSVRDRGMPDGSGWGAFALGPYLFVELTLMANLGKLEMISGLGPIAIQIASAVGFGAALVVIALRLPRSVAVALAIIAVVVLAAGSALGPLVLVALVLAQVGLALALVSAFTDATWRIDARTHALTIVGLVLLFALVFVFYSYRERGELLWPVAAALAVAPGVFARRGRERRTLRPSLGATAAIIVAALLAAIPHAAGAPAVSTGGDLTVITYNLHQGLDYWSVPSAEALADRIASANADVVALQEVNRGWDLSAGIDLFAYLRWRLPQYHAVYGRMDTDLFGNAILSRYPITTTGVGILPHINSALSRGYVWATLDAPGGALLFVSTHFTAYEGFDEERIAQADAYAAFWAKRPRSILAGDYNSHPEDVSVTRLVAAGLVDAPAAVGQGKTFTYSSGAPHERIDYVFVSPDITPVSAQVLEGTASDHSPVLVRLRVP
jgi:endonuclease/exonuclease/phosphatase family metal-dependent hydrolase